MVEVRNWKLPNPPRHERKAAEAEWRKANPEKAAQMDEWFSGKAPKVDWSKVEQKAGSCTQNDENPFSSSLPKNHLNL